jgi:hypothetical protein
MFATVSLGLLAGAVTLAIVKVSVKISGKARRRGNVRRSVEFVEWSQADKAAYRSWRKVNEGQGYTVYARRVEDVRNRFVVGEADEQAVVAEFGVEHDLVDHILTCTPYG